MGFLVFGPRRIEGSEQPVRMEASRQRALLASLLVHANEVASTDRLLGLAWVEDQPEPGALRCQLLHSQEDSAEFHLVSTGYEVEPCHPWE